MSNTAHPFERPQVEALALRLAEPRRFLQIVLGPRQVGKTTLVLQALERIDLPSRYASADEVGGRDRDGSPLSGISLARRRARTQPGRCSCWTRFRRFPPGQRR